MRKKVLLSFAMILFLLSLLVSNHALAVEPVKIAIHGEFTGRSATYGMGALNAVRFEVKKKNAAGGIKSLGGAKIELVEVDNATEPKNAVAAHERLGSNKEILAVLGPCITPQALPVEPIAGKYRIPTLFFTTTTDQIFENGNKYVFTLSTLASRIGETYALFMLEMQKKYRVPLNRITIAYPDGEYGQNVTHYFKARMKKAGLEKNIVLEMPFDAVAKDLSPIVLKLKAANPDFHLQVGYFADGKLFHDASFNMAFHPLQVGGVSSYTHPNLWKVLGEKIGEATIGNPKTFGADALAFDIPNPHRDAWVKSFSAENPQVPIEYTLFQGAMAAQMLFQAMEVAGKRDREAITDALHKSFLQKDDPRDLLGSMEKPGLVWQPNGKPNSWGLIVQWQQKEGKWETMTVYRPGYGIVGVPRAFK